MDGCEESTRICKSFARSIKAAWLNSIVQAILAPDLVQSDARAHALHPFCGALRILPILQIGAQGLANQIIGGLARAIDKRYELALDLSRYLHDHKAPP